MNYHYIHITVIVAKVRQTKSRKSCKPNLPAGVLSYAALYYTTSNNVNTCFGIKILVQFNYA